MSDTLSPKKFPALYSAEELALFWCRLQEGRHPTHPGWNFDQNNVAGAMALIVVLIGPGKCLARWRKEVAKKRLAWQGLERRAKPRD